MRSPRLALLLAAAACGSEPPGPPDGAAVEVGTGITSFEEIAPGGDLELVAGPQGGWHVHVTTRAVGLEPNGLILRYEVVDAESGDTLTYPVGFQIFPERVTEVGDGWVHLGAFTPFDVVDPSEVVGRDVEVRVRAEPVNGAALSDAATGTIVDAEP